MIELPRYLLLDRDAIFSNDLMRDSTSSIQANGSTLQRLQEPMKLRNTAAVLPPPSLPKKVQLPRPSATSPFSRSVAPLSISNSQSSTQICVHR
jgi:hypothetical protein